MVVNRNHNCEISPAQQDRPDRPAPSVTFTFTSRSALEFVRIALFTRNCWTAPRRRGSAKRSCANWNYTPENKTPQRMIDHSLSQFISAAEPRLR